MRTLDEVIKAYEQCAKSDWEEGCGDCAYRNEKCGSCKCVRNDDALHYLKVFRAEREHLDELHRELVKENDNKPISWDELKQMEGKPVWVMDSNGQGEWVLLSGMEGDELFFVYRTCNEYKLYREEQGERWQAYRKERS